MLKLISLQDYIQLWNYEVNLADDIEDPETLEQVFEFVKMNILEQCGVENPAVRLINKRAQIEEIPSDEA